VRTGGGQGQRKPVKRAFTGLAGGWSQPEPAAPVVTAPAGPVGETAAGLMAAMVLDYDKKKRGRGQPRKHVDGAAKQAAYRENKAEKDKRLVAEQAVRDAIDAVIKEHHDRRGEQGETSGGDVVSRVERKVEQGRLIGGRHVVPTGQSLHAFEEIDWRKQKIETDETWVNRQNFYTMSKWDARDVEVFTQDLIDIVCRKNNSDFDCRLCAFSDSWRPNTVRHIIESHQRFIRREVRRCRPKPLNVRKIKKNIVTRPMKTVEGT
jgi:hypothetical protein